MSVVSHPGSSVCHVLREDADLAEAIPAERRQTAIENCTAREIRVPDSVFAQVRRQFDDRELVELTATVAGYNLVSRFLVAMQIDQERRQA